MALPTVGSWLRLAGRTLGWLFSLLQVAVTCRWVVVAIVASMQVGAQCQVKDMALGPSEGAAGDLQAMTSSMVVP